MEKFEVHILGCGSALPTARHLGSCQVVNIREKLFMIDCAEGAQMQLRRNKQKFSHLNNIFISHLHGDHCFGLMGLISTFALLGRMAPLHIYGPKDLEKVFRPQIDYFCKGIEYKIELHEFETKDSALIYEDRSVSIYTIPLSHRIPCCGFLFKEKELQRHIKRDSIDAFGIPLCYINNIKAGQDYITPDGEIIPNHLLTTPADPARSYAYCSDTIYLPQNAEIIKNVDLLYHESTFGEDNSERAKQTFHSTASEAAKMAKLCNAKRLIIGHFSARYENESVLLEEAKGIFKKTILANENLHISI